MANAHAHDGNGHDHGHHVIPIPVLTKTFIILMVLMALTILAARLPYMFEGLKEPLAQVPLLTNLVALGIATAKAYFVVKIFMGVKFGTNLVKIFAIGGFVWFFLLFFMFVDFVSRPWEPVLGWEPEAPTAMPISPERTPFSGGGYGSE